MIAFKKNGLQITDRYFLVLAEKFCTGHLGNYVARICMAQFQKILVVPIILVGVIAELYLVETSKRTLVTVTNRSLRAKIS